MIKMATKRKKPLTCPVCKRKFSYSGKTSPMGRMSKHMWKEHASYMKRKQKAGQRKKKTNESQLDRELQWTDDMILASLQQAGIPLIAPQQAPILNPYAPTQHQSLAGAAIAAFKLGQLAHASYKVAKPIVKSVKRKRKK